MKCKSTYMHDNYSWVSIYTTPVTYMHACGFFWLPVWNDLCLRKILQQWKYKQLLSSFSCLLLLQVSKVFTGTFTRNIYSLKDRSIIIICSATLTSTPTVACPDDTVAFTCTLPGTMGVTIGWTVTPPTGLNVASASGAVSNSLVMNIIGSDGFMFRADYSGYSMEAW